MPCDSPCSTRCLVPEVLNYQSKMLRYSVLQPNFKRLFSSTHSMAKKARRLPIKRLIVPVEQRVDEMNREKGLVKQRLKEQKQKHKEHLAIERMKTTKKYKDQQKVSKDRSRLPVLESFTNADLSDGTKLVANIQEFSELNLLPHVRDAIMLQISRETVLRADNYETKRADDEELSTPKPTPIQVIAIHKMAKQLMEKNVKTYTMAAETGSGKTWAYLSPMVDYLKRQEQEIEDWEETMQSKAIIRSVILLPTHELVDQVYNSVQGLQDSLGLHCFKWSTTPHDEFVEAFKNRIDILVTTPGKLASIDKIRSISRPEHLFAHTKFLIADEADTLMDRSFVEMTHAAIRRMPRLNRLVLCSATVSTQYNDALKKMFPSSRPQLLLSPRTHTTPKSVKFTVIDAEVAPYQGSKLKACAQALYAIHKDGTERAHEKRCVVFINAKHDAETVAEKLREVYGHDAVSLTGQDTPEERREKISVFVNPPRPLEDQTTRGGESAEVEQYTVPGSNIILNRNVNDSMDSTKKMKVLVTTDLAARGINFFAVRNVVLYDSPNTSVDLLHRIGRTGRMGQSGRVMVIMDKKTKPWVKALVKKRSN